MFPTKLVCFFAKPFGATLNPMTEFFATVLDPFAKPFEPVAELDGVDVSGWPCLLGDNRRRRRAQHCGLRARRCRTCCGDHRSCKCDGFDVCEFHCVPSSRLIALYCADEVTLRHATGDCCELHHTIGGHGIEARVMRSGLPVPEQRIVDVVGCPDQVQITAARRTFCSVV